MSLEYSENVQRTSPFMWFLVILMNGSPYKLCIKHFVLVEDLKQSSSKEIRSIDMYIAHLEEEIIFISSRAV